MRHCYTHKIGDLTAREQVPERVYFIVFFLEWRDKWLTMRRGW